MARAPFQVLVLPYHQSGDGVLYALFKRAQAPQYWQGIAGGGENGEEPDEAARREASEEAGIDPATPLLRLESVASIPTFHFEGIADDLLVIPEYSFAVRCGSRSLTISREHSEYRWCALDKAMAIVRWDSNRTALWELSRRIARGLPGA